MRTGTCAFALLMLLEACGGGSSGTPVVNPTLPPLGSAGCPATGVAPMTASRFSARAPRAPARLPFTAHLTLRGLPAGVSLRHMLSFTADDPYYVGAPGTVAPYDESSGTHGQWDMHAINLDGAWSQFPGSSLAGAPIAVIDTGADLTLPELSGGKVVRAQCFVTYPAGTAQTTGSYVTDTDGHGTNVAGVADADTDNQFGFAAAAFNAPLLIYRIFPDDPPGGCQVDNPPSQCFTNTADEASAIDDAVAHGARVVNLSLGDDTGGSCSTGDQEYAAVENAIKAGVVVVAAAGNAPPGSAPPAHLDCPAADPGVIAVGASALNDSDPAAPFEYVASYSNYLSNNGTSQGGAYLVAPGGDPSSGSDGDNLHWIQNLYSTTAYDAVQRPSCTGGIDDYGERGDCNVEIAGTSQATPHVAGVVSLMLAMNPNLTPAQIASGLCASADSIADSKQGCGRLDAANAVTWAATH
jgi:serine protease